MSGIIWIEVVACMYKDVLSTEIKNTDLEKTSSTKIKARNNHALKFREILCPKNCQAISSENCKTCTSRQELHRKHELGLSLVTIICMWDVAKSTAE